MTSAVSAAFDAVLHAQGTSLTHRDLPHQSPRSKPLMEDQCLPCVPSLLQIQFYEEFAIDPQVANRFFDERRAQAQAKHGREYLERILRFNKHHELKKKRRFDFRLNPEETNKLQQNGFVVTERLAADSFAAQYYRLYTDDMPVYVTSDSVLHAWHRSFDAFLTELEESALVPLLQTLLDRTMYVCKGLRVDGNVVLVHVLRDVELYLAVTQALLTGKFPAVADEYVESLAMLVQSVESQQHGRVQLFSSRPRDVDFSLFKPRGHYTKTEQLSRFFQAMTWLGTIDFRIDGTEDHASDLRQLQRACVLIHVLRKAQVMETVDAIQTVISTIAGDGFGADSMTPWQLHELLEDTDIIATYCGLNSEAALRELQHEIANRSLGSQAITGHPMSASSANRVTRPPTSFAVFGPQFVWSAFLFSKIVYDQVLHDDTKVVRRMPSAVDAAFALFGNDVASGEIARRMTATADTSEDFVPFRDGVPYASNLLAARRVIDDQLTKADPTTASIALLWQLALRELSAKSANEADVFKSETWKKRIMNTQISSFTQLRHDTVLYAKQSSTIMAACEYAAGFVDPYPAFWTKMQQLVERMVTVVDTVSEVMANVQMGTPSPVIVGKRIFSNFAEVMGKLNDITVAQSSQQELTEQQDDFLKSVVEEHRGSGYSRYLGWYPSLFYVNREDSGKQDHLVADIHTDTPSMELGDEGGVLHLGVGDVNLGFFIVEGVMYAGPVFSSYEFVTPIDMRLTDSEFSAYLPTLEAPLWARESFLVSS